MRSIRKLMIACIALCASTGGVGLGQLRTPHLEGSQKIEAVLVVVTPNGPYPTSIERPEGPFLLAVVNRSGILEDTFPLVLKPVPSSSSSEDGAKPTWRLTVLHKFHSTGQKQRDHELLDPLPGSYELRFQSHPEWLVDIKITGK